MQTEVNFERTHSVIYSNMMCTSSSRRTRRTSVLNAHVRNSTTFSLCPLCRCRRIYELWRCVLKGGGGCGVYLKRITMRAYKIALTYISICPTLFSTLPSTPAQKHISRTRILVRTFCFARFCVLELCGPLHANALRCVRQMEILRVVCPFRAMLSIRRHLLQSTPLTTTCLTISLMSKRYFSI